MDWKRVCAIDVGYRNFAWCALDSTNWQAPDAWCVVDMWKPRKGRRLKPTTEQAVELMVEWVEEHKILLQGCDVIVLERQLRSPFLEMNAALLALLHGRVKTVNTMTVAATFHLPKKRALKKLATVELCQRSVQNMPKTATGKLDDLADAWAMAMHELIQRKGASIDSLELLK